MRRPPPILLVVLLELACGGSPWSVKNAPEAPPDHQFRTGVEAGEDVYIWECYKGERVVVRQFGSACFGTREPVLDHGPCGAPLPVESNYRTPSGGYGGGRLPESQLWPGSTTSGPTPATATASGTTLPLAK